MIQLRFDEASEAVYRFGSCVGKGLICGKLDSTATLRGSKVDYCTTSRDFGGEKTNLRVDSDRPNSVHMYWKCSRFVRIWVSWEKIAVPARRCAMGSLMCLIKRVSNDYSIISENHDSVGAREIDEQWAYFVQQVINVTMVL